MKRLLGVLCVLALAVSPAFTEAKPKKARHARAAKKAPQKQASAQTKRAMSDLMGKFKWDMTPEEAIKVIAADIRTTYNEKLKKVSSPLEQDKIRDEMNQEINKVRKSVIKFDGQRTSWDISIVDQEFAHRNGESMLVRWEQNQRRFLFFENGRLWKQFIALNAELFRGKSFDEFAEMIAARYGPPQKVMAKDLRGKERLDHLEWPPSGDYFLKAIDQSNMYGNYCLVLVRKSVMDSIAKRREENNPKHERESTIDRVMKAKSGSEGDGNANVVDQITGQQSAKPKTDEE